MILHNRINNLPCPGHTVQKDAVEFKTSSDPKEYIFYPLSLSSLLGVT